MKALTTKYMRNIATKEVNTMTHRNTQQSLMHGQYKRTKPTREYVKYTVDEIKQIKASAKEWRDVVGSKGKYQVSDTAEVRQARLDHYLKPYMSKSGYKQVKLMLDDSATQHPYNHQLVMRAYKPITWHRTKEDYDGLCINHIDQNKLNNDVIHNLEWCDAEYNTWYSSKAGKNYREWLQAKIAGGWVQQNVVKFGPQQIPWPDRLKWEQKQQAA